MRLRRPRVTWWPRSTRSLTNWTPSMRDRAVVWLARRVLRLASRRVAYGLMVAPVPPPVPGLPDRSAEWAALGGLIERTTGQRGASVGNDPSGVTICGTVPEHWWRLV